jgi:hypothetical protein
VSKSRNHYFEKDKTHRVAFLLWTGVSSGQTDDEIRIPFDSATQKYAYNKVVEVPGKPATELFSTTRRWCIQKFMENKFLYEEADVQLIDLGNFPITVVMKAGAHQIPFSYIVIYNLSVWFKPGKCKIVVTDIKMTQNAKGAANELPLESYKRNIANQKGLGSKKSKGMKEDAFKQIDMNVKKTLIELENNLKGEAGGKDW